MCLGRQRNLKTSLGNTFPMLVLEMWLNERNFMIHIHTFKVRLHSFGSKIPSNAVPSRTIFVSVGRTISPHRDSSRVRKRAQQRSIVQACTPNTPAPLARLQANLVELAPSADVHDLRDVLKEHLHQRSRARNVGRVHPQSSSRSEAARPKAADRSSRDPSSSERSRYSWI